MRFLNIGEDHLSQQGFCHVVAQMMLTLNLTRPIDEQIACSAKRPHGSMLVFPRTVFSYIVSALVFNMFRFCFQLAFAFLILCF